MKNTIFLCVGGDARQTYTAKALAEYGKVYTYGINDTGEKTIPVSDPYQMTERADILVLPVMKGEGLEISSFRGKKIYCSDVSGLLNKKALVTGGRLSRIQIEYFSSLGFDVKDYFNREELVIKNCIPTAEGALQIAMQELACTVKDSDVLIIGYGRVGKACAELFDAVGARTAVTARRVSQLAEAENSGLGSFSLSELYGRIARFSVIVNTVPAMILDETLLEAVGKDTLIIDLASKPGGVDFETAARLNRRVVWALSLPGKVAPMTSGEIVAGAVVNILQERGRKNVT